MPDDELRLPEVYFLQQNFFFWSTLTIFVPTEDPYDFEFKFGLFVFTFLYFLNLFWFNFLKICAQNNILFLFCKLRSQKKEKKNFFHNFIQEITISENTISQFLCLFVSKAIY